MPPSTADPSAEPDHMWRVQDVEFAEAGATTRYRCDLCLELLVVPPGGVHPDLV